MINFDSTNSKKMEEFDRNHLVSEKHRSETLRVVIHKWGIECQESVRSHFHEDFRIPLVGGRLEN
jgi:hypothetical protein